MFAPLEKPLIQTLTFGRVAARGRLRRRRSAFRSVEPRLSFGKAVQTGHLGVGVDVPPGGVEARLMQLAEAVEQKVGKPGNALVAIRTDLPVVGRQNCRNGDRLDILARRYQIRVVDRCQTAW